MKNEDYKTELAILSADIVRAKGYHVFLYWSRKNIDVDNVVKSLNNKIDDLAAKPSAKKTEKPLFTQSEFKF